MNFDVLTQQIITCNKCPRLLEWAETREGANSKYVNEEYWGKCVPGFGDPEAKVLIVGLAPGAHGANRTGRPFTGDDAGNYLFESLYINGYSNRPDAIDRKDGLELSGVYITNALRCVPPHDLPESGELDNCRHYLRAEIRLLKRIKIILALGEKAFNQVKKVARECGEGTRGMNFTHDTVYDFGPFFPKVLSCYHTSRRNFNTGLMDMDDLNRVIGRLCSLTD